MQIPQQDTLSTNRLSRVFNNTVATYKFYWFISILDIHMNTGAMRISVWDIVIAMISNAWYPIHYFRLSFGKSDSMYVAIKVIQELTGLPYDANKKQIESAKKHGLQAILFNEDKSYNGLQTTTWKELYNIIKELNK